MGRQVRALRIFCIAAAWAVSSQAVQEVRFKDGRVVTGEITQVSDSIVEIKADGRTWFVGKDKLVADPPKAHPLPAEALVRERERHGAGSAPDSSPTSAPPILASSRTPVSEPVLSETQRLVRALGDGFLNTRLDAARALERMGWEPASERELALYLVAAQKWDECVKMGEPTVDPLIRAITVDGAADALGRIGDRRGLDAMLALTNAQGEVGSHIVAGLRHYDDPRAKRIVQEHRHAIRGEILETLRRLAFAIGIVGGIVWLLFRVQARRARVAVAEVDSAESIETGTLTGCRKAFFGGCLPAMAAPLAFAVGWAILLREALTQQGPSLAPMAVGIPIILFCLPATLVSFLVTLWRLRKRGFDGRAEAFRAGLKTSLVVCLVLLGLALVLAVTA